MDDVPRTTPSSRPVGRDPVGEEGLRLLLDGLTAVRGGDFGTRLPEDGQGLLGEIATVFNGMAGQLSLFTSEVTRVAREVGTEGRLGGQAEVPGVSGTWKDLTESVNAMAGNLTYQVRDIAEVATAVADGDLTRKTGMAARGEILELKTTLNTMVDQLSSFADEVTRVAREVGTEGRLAATGAGPGQLLGWLNTVAHHLTEHVTATAVCGLYDPRSRTLRWSRAGHLPPVLVRDGAAAALPMPSGIMLGALDDTAYEETSLVLAPGDTLLLYTDGLVERRDSPVQESIARLLKAAGGTVDELEQYLDRLLTHSNSDTDDDTCLIGVRLR